MTFQLDIQVKRMGNIIEIVGTGASVNFYPKNYSKTLNTIVEKYLELQPDLASDKEELVYLKRGLEAHVTDIYKDYDKEQNKKNDREINRNNEEQVDNKINGSKKAKPECPTYKFSSNGFLYEAVILGGLPSFLKFENGQVKLTESVPEISRSLIPPCREEYAYEPYEFSNWIEIQTYFERARSETINSLYLNVKNNYKKYNDQDESVIILLAADTIFSYFQDLFPTTHYLDVVGENDTGKSSIGYTFEYTGYRPVRGTAISAANYYRVLGSVEPGQCTIIEDEADHIDQDPDKMRILKSGYEYNAKIPKINMNSREQKQTWYYAYCFKMRIAERSLDQYKAKGLTDRSFNIKCKPGSPQYSIKEITSRHSSSTDPVKQELHQELIDFRKVMLCYRLLHYGDALPNITTGLKNRDQELCGPLLQLFYGTDALDEIIFALKKFLGEKKETKSNSLEAALYPLILNLIPDYNYEIPVSRIWESLKDSIEGLRDELKPNQYQTVEYGTLYKNTITKMIVDKFGSGAGRKRRNNGIVLIFDDEKIRRFEKSYDTSVNIKVKIVSRDESEGSVCSAGTGGGGSTSIQIYNIGKDNTKIQLYKNNIIQNNNTSTSASSICTTANAINISNIKDQNKQITTQISTETVTYLVEPTLHTPPTPFEYNTSSKPNRSFLYSCYYCLSFQTDVEVDYQKDVIIKHPGKMCYPGKVDLERLAVEGQAVLGEINEH